MIPFTVVVIDEGVRDELLWVNPVYGWFAKSKCRALGHRKLQHFAISRSPQTGDVNKNKTRMSSASDSTLHVVSFFIPS